MQDALNAVRVAKDLGCRRFLFTGSQAEYGVKSELTDEETVCEPRPPPYGRAKLAVRQQAEVLCRELGLDYGHARIFSTYGPGDHPVVASFLLCPGLPGRGEDDDDRLHAALELHVY